jgi:hypothetical protein
MPIYNKSSKSINQISESCLPNNLQHYETTNEEYSMINFIAIEFDSRKKPPTT